MNSVSTGQAAERLGVTQVAIRKLIRTGQLIQVGTVGRAILVDAHSVEQLARTGTRHGRPWNEENAWAALALLSGSRNVDWSSPTQISRLRQKLSRIAPAELPILARKRALVHRYRGTADVVQRLRDHILPTGAAAMANDDIAARFGLSGGTGIADGYVTFGDAEALKEAYGLIEDREGNIVVREVSISQAFANGVPLAAVALDLLESPATRERSAARQVIEDLLNGR